MPNLWEACKALSQSQCKCMSLLTLHKWCLETATVGTKQLPMFVLSNSVCQNNLHVQILNDSVINAKHNFAADGDWYHIDIINFFSLYY